MVETDLRAQAQGRTAAVRRLKRATGIVAMATAALAAAFTAVAARSAPGKHHAAVVQAPKTATTATVPAPPALPSSAGTQEVTPLAPAPAPVATQQDPVVVSGGS
jgi:hypothetical protein